MMYNSKRIHLHTRPSVLDDSIKESFNTRASDSIYYGKYPYKVSLDTQELKRIAIELDIPFAKYENDFRWEFRDFSGNFNHEYKVYFNNSHRIYLTDYGDFDWTLTMYGDLVREIQGPLHDDHLDMLYDLDCHLVSKIKGWYGKYDYRMEVWANYWAIRNIWLSSSGNGQGNYAQAKKATLQDDMSGFIDQIESQDYDMRMNVTNVDRYSNLTMFFNLEDYNEIMTFKRLMLNNFNTKITRAIYD